MVIYSYIASVYKFLMFYIKQSMVGIGVYLLSKSGF